MSEEVHSSPEDESFSSSYVDELDVQSDQSFDKNDKEDQGNFLFAYKPILQAQTRNGEREGIAVTSAQVDISI